MNRRELLTKGAMAAGVAVASPTLLNAVRCIQGDGCITCEQLGMAGTYPNCYSRKYLNYPWTLSGNLLSARLGVYHAVNGRTITQAQYNTMLNYHYQYNGVMSIPQTGINEVMRQSYIQGMLYQAPSSSTYSAAQNWASNNGLDPNIATEMLNAVTPDLIGFVGQSNESLQQQINNLPNTQAWDNLEGFIYAQTSNVTVQSGICQLAAGYNTPQGMIKDAESLAMVGGGLIAAGMAMENDALSQAGGLITGGGFVLWLVGTMCQN